MPAGASWEWVNGDAHSAAQYGLILGVILGIGTLIVSSVLLTFLGMFGIWPGPYLPLLPSMALMYALLAAQWSLMYFYPRRFPVLGRLGISPLGLRLVLPIRGTTVSWTKVRAVGRAWMDIDSGFLTLRFSLTLDQARKVREFLQIGEAAPRYPYPSVARPA